MITADEAHLGDGLRLLEWVSKYRQDKARLYRYCVVKL